MNFGVLRVLVVGLFLCLVAGVLGATVAPTLVHLQVKDRAEQDRVGRIINLEERTRGFDLYGWASAEQLKELDRQGYSFEVVTEDRDPQALTMCTDPDGPPFEPPVTWDCYPAYSQYVELMTYYATTYPTLCSLVDIGGTQDGDHRLLALKISDTPSIEEDEPEFFYTATMHGDETAGYVLTLRLIDDLLSLYATRSEISDLVDNMVIWINPLANPDGTFAGDDSSVSGSRRSLSNGADPNRNFPDPSAGDDPDTGSWYTEIQAMIDLAEDESFVMSANFHGGAEVVNYPWDEWTGGYPDYLPHPDDAWYQTVSRIYADAVHAVIPSGYMDGFNDGITNGGDWYVIDGGRQDFMNYYHGCREVTIELSDVKTLDSNQLEAHWNYNRQAMLDFMKEALNGIRGVVTDATSGDPVAATVKVVGHDSETFKTFAYADPDVGDYYRPIEAGTWDLEFSAEGYETLIVNGIVAADGTSTRQDVQMTALVSRLISGVVTDVDTGVVIAGATVELTDTSIPAVVTNGSGIYTFVSVWEGNHTLAVSATGFGRYEEQIVVAAGSVVFDVELAPIQTALFEDFESDDGGFSASGSWQWGTDSTAGAASGTQVWGTVIGGDYGQDEVNWTLDSPPINLAVDLDSAQLEFAHWYDTEGGFDGGQVQISVDGGSFQLVTPDGNYPDSDVDGLGNQPGYTGSSAGWETTNFDLGAFIGHSIIVRWRFGTDFSVNDHRGWYIDDVKILTTGGTPLVPELFADGFESGDTTAWAH